ncbi:MAG: hypothetical protein IBJ16_05045 [Chitinophagaceae bacterium]|nr:hypothetical protein [Chitinophagaceae bacterium]
MGWKCCFTGVVTFFLFMADIKSADTLISLKLLQRIDQLQVKDSGVFPKGLFPSYRIYALNQHRQKADINVFFTALIAFTLRDLMSGLTIYQQSLAQKIIDKSLVAADQFKNKKGRNTYNFWSTDEIQVFPNSGWLQLFRKKNALPDDLDDTAIMLLAQAVDKPMAKEMHKLMQEFVNGASSQIKNTFPQYRTMPAYSTWFGKKMPIDFDICVLSNVLLMVQRYDLVWTKADSASVDFIVRVIQDKKHLTHASYVSPHYANPAIILYHLSRLMSTKKIGSLEVLKAQMVNEAKELLLQSHSFLEQVILSTALLKWGVTPPVVTLPKLSSIRELIEDESFSFFIANMASMLPDQFKKFASKAQVGKFYYYCPAYNQLLLLEHVITNQRMALHSQ